LKIYRASVNFSSNYIEDVAEKITEIYNIAVSESKDNNFKTISEVQSDASSSFIAKKSVSLNRDIQTLWVYPVNKGNMIDLTIVFQYKISEQQDTSNGTSEIEEGEDFTETISGLNMTMVFVKGGSFKMGSNSGNNDEKPEHSATVNDFYIGRTEVTQAQYKIVTGSNPSYNNGCPTCPVERVSYNEAQNFIIKLNQLTGKTFRLPTEAEWEYAARGGNSSNGYKYSGSDTLDAVGWYENNSNNSTNQVAKKRPNELGIFDMSGNVWEWCNEWYKGYPGSTGITDYTGTFRVNHGGAWSCGEADCRVSNRNSGNPNDRGISVGIRLALSVK